MTCLKNLQLVYQQPNRPGLFATCVHSSTRIFLSLLTTLTMTPGYYYVIIINPGAEKMFLVTLERDAEQRL